MKICNQCGTKISDNDSKFCFKCGNNIENAPIIENENQQENMDYSLNNNYAYYGKTPYESQVSDKSKIAAGILNIFLPGVGRLYAGHIGIGLAQLLGTILTCGLLQLWSFIDGIIMLCSDDLRDGQNKLMK